MTRLFSVIAALLFAGSISYFWWWYGGPFGAPDVPEATVAPTGVWPAVVWDIGIFSLFALHHSFLARSGLKAAVSRLVSPNLERTIYVWTSSVLFFGVCWAWREVPGVFWSARTWWPLLFGLQLLGMGLTVIAARRLNLLDPAGFRHAPGQTSQQATVVTDGVYSFVRHPVYFAWLLIVWPTPHMTGTRLVFAAISSLYLVIAIEFEERDLVRTLGASYQDYRRQMPWKIIPYVY